MKDRNLIGREYECRRLEKSMEETQAQLIIVYGRRRVGKTYLIEQFFDGRFDFKFTGAYNQTKEIQLRNFSIELGLQSGKTVSVPKDWTEAFILLREYLTTRPEEEKKIVFFDEMPWMDTQKSGFLAAFEYFWNSWGSSRDNLVFIVCGSANSWMVENMDRNKGGLFNRWTCRIYLKPFSLGETEQYLSSRGINWSRLDIVRTYMILGGIPYYLRLLEKELSLGQNIDRLFFRKRAELWDEFEMLYRTLFENSESYIKIAKALCSKRKGLTWMEIIKETGLHGNGVMSRMLSNLEDSGFIRKQVNKRQQKETLYIMCDYYTLFYFRFLNLASRPDEHFWSNCTENPSIRAWEGLTFENVCMDHVAQIKQKLGISGVLTTESSWADADAQIDLVMKRRDHFTNLCEIKFSTKEYEIDNDYETKLMNKISSYVTSTKTKDSIQLTMITTFGVRRNSHSNIMTNQVTMDDLFEITPASIEE